MFLRAGELDSTEGKISLENFLRGKTVLFPARELLTQSGAASAGLLSGIQTQVVNPSVPRAAVPQGTAFTGFVEPSGSTIDRPGPISIAGSGPEKYGVAALGGPYAPV
jgi:hypothetical protein